VAPASSVATPSRPCGGRDTTPSWSPARGVDVLTGEGLDDALAGVDAVIDVSNAQAPDAQATQHFFAAATRNLLAAEQRAQVRHHVLLSIVGVDRLAAGRG
jgi:hypothetical protein